MKFEKYTKDGKTAVLYSPGFGSGWSTWNREPIASHMAMDRLVVEAFLTGDSSQIEKVVNEIAAKYGCEYVCLLSSNELEICWVDSGEVFIIDEYDGFERVESASKQNYYEA